MFRYEVIDPQLLEQWRWKLTSDWQSLSPFVDDSSVLYFRSFFNGLSARRLIENQEAFSVWSRYSSSIRSLTSFEKWAALRCLFIRLRSMRSELGNESCRGFPRTTVTQQRLNFASVEVLRTFRTLRRIGHRKNAASSLRCREHQRLLNHVPAKNRRIPLRSRHRRTKQKAYLFFIW